MSSASGPVRGGRFGPAGAVLPRQLVVVASAAVVLVAAGTVGFVLIRDDGWIAAFYRTVTIVTTAGMADPPRGTSEQLLTAVLLLTGVALFFYGVGLFLELVVRGTVADLWSRNVTRRRIEQMRDHHVVCGYGRVGCRIVEELRAAGADVVVVDQLEEAVRQAAADGVSCVQGSGTDEAILTAAGVPLARSLVACAGDDAVNTFIVLTAKGLREDLHVVARASSDASAPKLARAGADEVVSPYVMAGRQIARLLTRPHVTAFLSAAIGREDTSFTLEEIEIAADWAHAGSTLQELDLQGRTGATVLAIRRPGRPLEAEPAPGTVLEPGSIVVGAGSPQAIASLERLLGAGTTPAGAV